MLHLVESPQQFYEVVYGFTRAAITKYYRLGVSKQQKSIFSWSWGLEAQDQCAVMVNIFQSFFPWLASGTFALCPHVAIPLSMPLVSLLIRTKVRLDEGPP